MSKAVGVLAISNNGRAEPIAHLWIDETSPGFACYVSLCGGSSATSIDRKDADKYRKCKKCFKGKNDPDWKIV